MICHKKSGTKNYDLGKSWSLKVTEDNLDLSNNFKYIPTSLTNKSCVTEMSIDCIPIKKYMFSLWNANISVGNKIQHIVYSHWNVLQQFFRFLQYSQQQGSVFASYNSLNFCVFTITWILCSLHFLVVLVVSFRISKELLHACLVYCWYFWFQLRRGEGLGRVLGKVSDNNLNRSLSDRLDSLGGIVRERVG